MEGAGWFAFGLGTSVEVLRTLLRSQAASPIASTAAHDVPMRVLFEAGLVAFVPLGWLSAVALLCKPMQRLLVTLMIYGLMEYSAWAGQLAGLWWLVLGLALRRQEAAYGASHAV